LLRASCFLSSMSSKGENPVHIERAMIALSALLPS
jgi:hypothetical protein